MDTAIDARPVPPSVGGEAPNVLLHDAGGAVVELARLWGAPPGGVALVFLRHFG